MRKLETCLVNRAFVEYRSLSQTKSLLRAERAVLPRPKRESAGASLVTAVLIFVAGDQRVVLIELIIEPRTEFEAAIRQRNGFGKRNDVEARIENRRIDDCLIVDVALLDVKKERCFLFRDRTAEVAAQLPRHVRGSRQREWIARIQNLIVEIEASLTPKTIRSWSAETFDPAKARPIIF